MQQCSLLGFHYDRKNGVARLQCDLDLHSDNRVWSTTSVSQEFTRFVIILMVDKSCRHALIIFITKISIFITVMYLSLSHACIYEYN